MKISVIVPVYNEERTVKKVLKELLKISSVTEIIVVNDGSTDRSAKEIKSLHHPKIHYLEQKNKGKGSAILHALQKVSEKYVLIQDADLEYHPEDIPLLVEPIMKRETVKVVFGSRFLGPHSNLLYWHMVGNKFINFLVNILFDTTLSDLETCYKLVPTALLKELNLSSSGFEVETEITCKILRKRIRIFEVPISYVGRDFTEGKKITWKDGIKAIWSIVKYRVT